MIEAGLHFWEKLEEVVAAHNIVIERPAGSRHPQVPDIAYPVDCGRLAGTPAPDGSGTVIFIGSSGDARVDGVLCTLDLVGKGVELQILMGCTPAEMQALAKLLNTGPLGALLVERE